MIIANDHLFDIQVSDLDTILQNSRISIFEMKIEDKLLIPIIQIMFPKEMQCDEWIMQAKFIFGIGNKITIMGYQKDVGITYNACAHEQEEFRNNVASNCKYCNVIYPYKCTLVSPKHRQT